MAKAISLVAALTFCARGRAVESDALPMDDDCGGSEEALHLLQSKGRRVLADVDWVELVEGAECPSTGLITCTKVGLSRHFKFPAGEFTVPRQVSIPENTILEGAANPNDNDKTKKPDYTGQTVFVASDGLSDGDACYCQNLLRSWEPPSKSNPHHCDTLTNEQVKSLRKGFLMYSNTVVKNIAFQGKDTLRPSDNGALCGGAVFETPGCVHNSCEFPSLMTGNGKPVSNVLIENVRLNDYSDNPKHSSQLAVWTAQTSYETTPTTDIRVNNLVAMFLHADGINFHGYVQNAIVDDTYIQNTGDDIFAVWGSRFDTTGIVFMNSVGVDAGRARNNHYGSCVAVYGAKEATFRNLSCYAPEQNTADCYDAKHRGETCNGCLGIIKESFDADYSKSEFTFTKNKFYDLKRVERDGRQIYDLKNPQKNTRPEVCNNEWTKGGLIVNVDYETSATYTSLGGTAVNEGNGVGAKSNCDLSCCKAYCTQESQCKSFAWSSKFSSCFLKDAVLHKGSEVKTGGPFTTYIKNR